MMSSLVTAVLGPTNTGKTYLAVEKMMKAKTAMIGFPLRLLARENYDKVVSRYGADKVALITGEEKIVPESPTHFICTVEAMPMDRQVDFLAVDEIQMAADGERGHVFTDRLLHARGRVETMFLGAETARPLLERLLAGIYVETRPRFSKLSYTGVKKITRLPPRSAIVAFSLADVYALAELIRRQRGGAAVVMGALSPRTRNAQVDMFQSGEVDYLVATDAIGMGLNMDVANVCFASLRKFDGQRMRMLSAAELGQIAGRAGRHMKDGTFCVAAEASSLPPETIERIEEHRFEPLDRFYWRNSDLRFGSIESLLRSLNVRPDKSGLIGARKADDQLALEALVRDPELCALANHPSRVRLLWEVAGIPDFRKITPEAHARLLSVIYLKLLNDGIIKDDWFAKQVQNLNKTDGDIDTLTGRIAGIRIWTYIAQRRDWINRSGYWQEMTKSVEDELSDALHQKLTRRFVDRRTSVLVKGMKTQVELFTKIGEDGLVEVEGQEVGRLEGLRFIPETGAGKFADKVLITAAEKALQEEFKNRVAALVAGNEDDFSLENDARLMWKGQPVGKAVKGRDALHPAVQVSVHETLDSALVEQVKNKLSAWLDFYLNKTAAPLFNALRVFDEEKQASGAVRGILWQTVERLGTIPRANVRDLIKAMNDDAEKAADDKKVLARAGVRLGYDFVFFPMLLKPAAQRVCALLWKIGNEKTQYPTGFAVDGKMSIPVEKGVPHALYLVQGYVLAGGRAIRVDVMERFTAKLREVTRQEKGKPRPLPLELLSLAGLKRDEAADVFSHLGFVVTKETVKDGETETETLMIQSRPKKFAQKTDKGAEQKTAMKSKGGKNKKAGKPEKEKPVDADSPFACLASLKK